MSDTLELFKAMLQVNNFDEVDKEYLQKTVNKLEAELKNRERAKKFQAVQNFREAFNRLREEDITPSITVHCYESPCLSEEIPIFDFDDFTFEY